MEPVTGDPQIRAFCDSVGISDPDFKGGRETVQSEVFRSGIDNDQVGAEHVAFTIRLGFLLVLRRALIAVARSVHVHVVRRAANECIWLPNRVGIYCLG